MFVAEGVTSVDEVVVDSRVLLSLLISDDVDFD